MEILARFADKDERLEEEGYYKVDSELGNVFLPQRGVAYSDTLTFGVLKFLWMPRITVDGANVASGGAAVRSQ